MSTNAHANDSRVAVLVDCENTQPDILDYALRVVAQFGRIGAGSVLSVQISSSMAKSLRSKSDASNQLVGAI